MFCINCGKELPEESTFCIQCGEKVGKHGGVSNAALILAITAAGVSMFFALYSSLNRPGSPQTAAGGPSPSGPIVTLTQVPKTSLSPSPSPTADSTPTPAAASGSRQVIAKENVIIRPRRYRSYRFVVDPNYRNPRLVGFVSASGGENDVYVVVVDDRGLDDFAGGGGFSSFYEYKIFNLKRFTVPLQPGAYNIIISNRHAQFLAKRIRAELAVEFD